MQWEVDLLGVDFENWSRGPNSVSQATHFVRIDLVGLTQSHKPHILWELILRLEAHNKVELIYRYTNSLEQKLLSRYCQVSSTYINRYGILWRAKSSMGFPRKLSNVSHIRKSFSDRFRAHLAAPTEWVSSQTNKNCLCKSISPHAHAQSP